MYSQQAVGLVIQPSNEEKVQTFQLTVDVVQTGSWSVKDAGGSRTHFRLLCRQPPCRLAPASVKCPRQESNLVYELRGLACESGTLQEHVVSFFQSTPPGSRTPSCGPEDHCASITLARRKHGNQRCEHRWLPIMDSCQSQSVRVRCEPFCLASLASSASPLRSNPRYNRALAFLAGSRSASNSAILSSAG